MRSFDQFRLDVENQCLWRGETRVELMPKPFAVLSYLVEHPGRLVTHDQLLNAIWPQTYVQPEGLRRYVLEIRRALGDSAETPHFVQTVRKRGYQFLAPVVDDSVSAVAEGASINVPRLVGRGPSFAHLGRCLTRALSGRRQVVFVVGEPGIGKTSLVDAFQRVTTAIPGIAVAHGQCVEGFGGKEPYYPLLEAVGRLTRGPARTLVVDTLATSAPTWLVQYPSLIRAKQQGALQRELLGASRERMVRELGEALELITQTVPLLLVLEDLHWVDHSTLDVISAIARRSEPAKLFVLATFRPADVILSESPLKALKQDLLLHRLAEELELELLEPSDVDDYIAAEFAPGDIPPGLASVIHRHSDGNPLFMTVMLDHLVQRGVLVQADERWTMTVPLEQFDPGVPDTLRQLLELQLQRLTDAEQQLLKCASVAGQCFTTSSLATMLADAPSNLEGACEALAERQQFLRASGAREWPDGTATAGYQFRHALYREVLYRRLSPALRVTYHRRLAEGLEPFCSSAEPEMASEIALHFAAAHEYKRATRYLVLATEKATRRYAHEQSIAVLQQAVGLMLCPPLRGTAGG